MQLFLCFFFFFNDTATTEIYTLSLHDALPILDARVCLLISDQVTEGVLRLMRLWRQRGSRVVLVVGELDDTTDRKSTRLNSSHANISYAVFCLKKKKKIICT